MYLQADRINSLKSQDVSRLFLWLCIEVKSVKLEEIEIKSLSHTFMVSFKDYGFSEFKHMVDLFKQRKMELQPVRSDQNFRMSGVFFEDLKSAYRQFRGPAINELLELKEDNTPKPTEPKIVNKEAYDMLDNFCRDTMKLPQTHNWTSAFDYAKVNELLSEYDREEVIAIVLEEKRAEASKGTAVQGRKVMHQEINRLKDRDIHALCKVYIIQLHFKQKYMMS